VADQIGDRFVARAIHLRAPAKLGAIHTVAELVRAWCGVPEAEAADPRG
jgi:hypothetical protein